LLTIIMDISISPIIEGGFMVLPNTRQFLILIGAVSITWGCALPQTSRTASIHDVKIEESVSPDNLLVQPGDEVRWVNLRKLPVTVDIPTLNSEDLACSRGFTNFFGMLKETAELGPNETASLCYKKPAVVNYNVRSETALAGGKLILPGVVKVGTPLNR
jgi:plastocyanin